MKPTTNESWHFLEAAPTRQKLIMSTETGFFCAGVLFSGLGVLFCFSFLLILMLLIWCVRETPPKTSVLDVGQELPKRCERGDPH